MTERRYTDEEVEQILARAAEAESTGAVELRERGWTLAEIQRVASEAGVSADAVEVAAASVDMSINKPAEPRLLGAPVGVARTAAMPRGMTDDEWRQLVHLLRDTFAAQGRESSDSIRREWRNGNLRALVERGESHARVEIRSVNGQGQRLMALGGVFAALGTLLTSVIGMSGHPVMSTPGPMILTIGVAMFAGGWVRTSRWSRARRDQFEEVIRAALRLTSTPATPSLPRDPSRVDA